MRNTLGDLNNHLFMQLERLGDEDLVGVELEDEINRAKAMSSIATKIIENGSLVLKARQYYDDDNRINLNAQKPKMLEG